MIKNYKNLNTNPTKRIKNDFLNFNEQQQKIKDFLVNNELCNCIFETCMLDDGYLGDNNIVLHNTRRELLERRIRGNVEIKDIEQAYKAQLYTQLKTLIEEKFLQQLSQEDYNMFLENFRYYNWTWFELISQFNKNISKSKHSSNILNIVSKSCM